jgi:hypothetical protein
MKSYLRSSWELTGHETASKKAQHGLRKLPGERRVWAGGLTSGDFKMRAPILTGLLATCALGLLSSASAQPVTAPVVDPPPAWDVGPDDEVVVREYIIRRRPPPPAPVVVAPAPVVTAPAPVIAAPAPPALVIRPGSIIPADVELEPFVDAPLPALRRYSYFVSPSNKIVVVEPVERRVVRVLER